MPLEPEASPDQAVTRLLGAWKNGSKEALDLLTPIIYDELRRLAASYLRGESAAATLQPTVVVHEAYLRLVAQNMPDWESRAHFFGVAARLMRQILVDNSRRRRSAKRGSGVEKVSLDEVSGVPPVKGWEIEALDDAMQALGEIDPLKCKVIELRFFGGFTVEETSRALDLSVSIVRREQRMAEVWLHREIGRRGASAVSV